MALVAPEERRAGDRFDKAFAVHISGAAGVTSGIGRNISDGGMFIEVREPYPLGSRVAVTFTAPGIGTEVTLLAEVRYQCYINYVGPNAHGQVGRGGMRGMGVRFVGFDEKPTGQNGQMQ